MSLKKHIPNALTCGNLISGCIAVLFGSLGLFTEALSFILIGAFFDFFDGFSARLLHVSSPIGKELDSLADVITFGLAPSFVLFCLLGNNTPEFPLSLAESLFPYLAFLMAAFSALRLAKFNLDARQTSSFIGLPTPANALFWAALACSLPNHSQPLGPYMGYILLLLLGVFCYLLVAEIPMFALKFHSFAWRENKLRYSFIVVSIIFVLLGGTTGLACDVLLYIFLSVLSGRNQRNQA